MQAGPIIIDTSERSWFNRLRFPVALVQTFQPCDWSDLHSYFCEAGYFNDEVFRARNTWLKECGIKCQVDYDNVETCLEPVAPRVYRLFTRFTCTADAIAYKVRWL